MMLEIFLSRHKEMTWSTELILAAHGKIQATFMEVRTRVRAAHDACIFSMCASHDADRLCVRVPFQTHTMDVGQADLGTQEAHKDLGTKS